VNSAQRGGGIESGVRREEYGNEEESASSLVGIAKALKES